MSNDIINALFEMAGAFFVCFNVAAMYRDKTLKGASVLPCLFFTSWGVWNLFFYPSLDQYWSGVAAVFLTAANAVWLVQVWYYRGAGAYEETPYQQVTHVTLGKMHRLYEDEQGLHVRWEPPRFDLLPADKAPAE